MQLTTVKLWRCPECGDLMFAEGHNDSVCEGNKYESAAHPPTSGEVVTYVPLDQVIELVEAAAKAEGQLSHLAPGHNAYSAIHTHAEIALQCLATQLKESSDHE